MTVSHSNAEVTLLSVLMKGCESWSHQAEYIEESVWRIR